MRSFLLVLLLSFFAVMPVNASLPYYVLGTKADDVLISKAKQDNIVDGYSGDDIIKSYGGNNSLYGGQGDDTYYHIPLFETHDKIVDFNYPDESDLNVVICRFPDDDEAYCNAFQRKDDLLISCKHANEEGGAIKSSITLEGYFKARFPGSYDQKWYISCANFELK